MSVTLEAPVKTCDERKTKLLAYPYFDPYDDPKRKTIHSKKETATPWTLIVCPSCQAHEIMTFAFSPKTPIRPQFARQMWKRFHGYVRLVKGDPAKGILDRREYVTPDWAERLTMNEVELAALTKETKGIPLDEAFAYWPEEEEVES